MTAWHRTVLWLSLLALTLSGCELTRDLEYEEDGAGEEMSTGDEGTKDMASDPDCVDLSNKFRKQCGDDIFAGDDLDDIANSCDQYGETFLRCAEAASTCADLVECVNDYYDALDNNTPNNSAALDCEGFSFSCEAPNIQSGLIEGYCPVSPDGPTPCDACGLSECPFVDDICTSQAELSPTTCPPEDPACNVYGCRLLICNKDAPNPDCERIGALCHDAPSARAPGEGYCDYPCENDLSCPSGTKCDTSSGICSLTSGSAICNEPCSPDERCDPFMKRCLSNCQTSADCSAGELCHPDTGLCAPSCSTSTDCPEANGRALVCDGGVCRMKCPPQCPGALTCKPPGYCTLP